MIAVLHNPFRVSQRIPPRWEQTIVDWGHAKVEHYASGRSPNSRRVSGNRGTESNPELQALGKRGEVAFALYANLNPAWAVDWSLCDGDAGADVILLGGTEVDVKCNYWPTIYPSVDVNHLYARRRFMIMVGVTNDRRDPAQCWIEGWVTKREFLIRKLESQGRQGEPPVPGTWYMRKVDLRPIESLIRIDLGALMRRRRDELGGKAA